ncbi:flagellar hook-length control protein FliK [Mobiluncus curtisii]|uniref:flagellar hook-length control protein FliK n=1 Tax=Mobiluncus curtisii TaxID=2051 RepID=UPI0001E0E945|nr:flagellar hook-length control protein FliK [Mobiluncus curtisii]EFL93972.1 flagellar hook-length control protein [Mobiluncus curtisii subsp. curtisii ATCC 35241]QQT12603.1 flagellar hook-length control protein FliK [Mobiluncus curtisii]STY77847.1 Flagellar hook-length control protein FliK [Mobiluncus curtisii subsp. curtisii]
MIDIKDTNAAAIAAQAASSGAKAADTTAFESLMSALATEARTPAAGVARHGENHPDPARDSRPAAAKPSHARAPEPVATVRPSSTRRDATNRPEEARTDKPARPERLERNERPGRPERPERVAAQDQTSDGKRAEDAKSTDKPGDDASKSTDAAQTSDSTSVAETTATDTMAASTGVNVAAEIVETLTETPVAPPEVSPEEPNVSLTSEETAAPATTPLVNPAESTPETVEVTPAQPETAPGTPELPAAHNTTAPESEPIDGADIAAQLKSGKVPSLLPAQPETVAPVMPEGIEPAQIMAEAVAAAAQTAGNSANTTAAGGANAGTSAVSAVSGTSAQTTPMASAAPAAAPAVSTPNPVSQAAPTYAPNLNQQLFDQMQHQLSRLKMLGQGQHQLKLAINPETFGPVRVAANFHADGTVHLQLLGASEAAREQLRQALSDLRRDLASTGLQADLDVATDAQEFAQFTGAGAGSSERETGQARQAGAAGTDGSETETENVVTQPKVGDVLKDGTDGSVDMFA